MAPFEWKALAVGGSMALQGFTGFSSQALFRFLEPGPLEPREVVTLNALVVCALICYWRSSLTNPGVVPDKYHNDTSVGQQSRWCKKCLNVKPPRAHHCKECKRCIPKMDHHCMWIYNCVSHRVFPHFIRMLFFAVSAMAYLESLILVRIGVLWEKRRLPSYLGPSPFQLIHLFLLIIVNSLALFGLFIVFVRSAWSLGSNTTTIEGWEMERHAALLRRARKSGGQVYGPNGVVIKIEKHEFPFDIGIWSNMIQGMGSRNIFSWFYPFAASMPMDSGTVFEVNGIDYPTKAWPPPDPERMPANFERPEGYDLLANQTPDFSDKGEMEAFRKRQNMDINRQNASWNNQMRRRQGDELIPVVRSGTQTQPTLSHGGPEKSYANANAPSWSNWEGDRLGDFGVDEETELNDEDIPLSQLIGKKRL